jgi:acetyl-CoA carboxylase biotin carboxyl carrier protein
MMLRRRGSLNYDEGATVKGPEPSAVLADMEAVAARLWTDIRPLPAAVTVRYGDIEVRLEAAQAAEATIPPAVMPTAAGNGAAASAAASSAVRAGPPPAPAQAPVPGASPVAPAPAIPAANDHHVRAPLVGTFYRAPAPGEPPFVEIGDVIRTGQQVAIIEAMKMMVPVETDVTGRVTDILIGNGEPVEFGSSLVVVTGG